jgi:hypothetical protein
MKRSQRPDQPAKPRTVASFLVRVHLRDSAPEKLRSDIPTAGELEAVIRSAIEAARFSTLGDGFRAVVRAERD